MKVLIVGAGIAGLSFSAHLQHKLNIKPVIIERVTEWKNLGFVIGLWPNGLRTLKEFDVHEKLKDVAVVPQSFFVRDREGNVIKEIGFEHFNRYGEILAIQRADFHKFLLDLNADADIRMGTTITHMKAGPESTWVKFSDNTEDTFDLVVGCDGMHSKIREYVSPENIEHPCGITGFLLMTKTVHLEPTQVSELWDENKFFGIYPGENGFLHVIIACPTEELNRRAETGIADFLRNHFKNINWLLPQILSGISDDQIFHNEWKIVKTNNWYKNRVVLIGDSAHAMVPTLGMGANMALEDAYVLAKELVWRNNIETAVDNYFTKRKTRVSFIFNESLGMTNLTKAGSPLFRHIRNMMIYMAPIHLIEMNLDYILSYDPTNDYKAL